VIYSYAVKKFVIGVGLGKGMEMGADHSAGRADGNDRDGCREKSERRLV